MSKPWIQTYSGIQFYPENPTIDMIDIKDIAHGLSHICRYSGQCPEFYSVAQHSILVSYVVYLRTGNARLAMKALLHDATEAYFSDIPKPVKQLLPDYEKLEAKLSDIIYTKFNLSYDAYEEIKRVDTEILTAEYNDFNLDKYGYDWELTCPAPQELLNKIVPLSSKEAKEKFMIYYHSYRRNL